MPKYVIERELPGAGDLTDAQISDISRKSNQVLDGMPDVQWNHSYVTGDKIYCVYVAPDADRLRAHADGGGFPANSVNEVRRMIDPTSGGR